MLDIKDLFDRYADEYLRFERVQVRMHRRPDLHAFLLLDSLVPDDREIVFPADYGVLHLAVKPEELAAVATEGQIIDLIRCGVLFDDERCDEYGLYMNI